MPNRILLDRIEEAARVIDPVFLNAPLRGFSGLSRELGLDLALQIETLNPIRSFKGRGADYCLHRYLKAGDKQPIVVASAGNFGQGMAYSARRRGMPIRIFAAETANALKVAKMRQLGADVVLEGDDFDAAKAAARKFARSTGARFLEDGLEPAVTEGAGTIAIEMLRWTKPYDAIVIPLGNGALLNGIATWFRAHSPDTLIIGVCAAGAPAMRDSWRSGVIKTTETIQTISDGIGVRIPVPEALEDMKGLVDDVVLVDDATTLRAMRLLLRETGLLVEPAGAVGVAALLSDRERWNGMTVGTILCGANVTTDQFAAWFSNGLVDC